MDFSLIMLSLVVLILPMISFLVISFFGKKMPGNGNWFSTSILFVNLFLSIYIFIRYITDGGISFTVEWINLGTETTKLKAGVVLDSISCVMLVVVNLISAVVHLFSIKYMEGDSKYSRYFAHLGLFTFSMLGIVLTNNLLLMYVFWELVGISSYLLIGFWYEKKAPQKLLRKHLLLTESVILVSLQE